MMARRTIRRGLLWLAIACCAGLAATAPAAGPKKDELPRNIVEDSDVPYGVAANWLMGHRLLEDGDAAGALPYLHMAYRTHPNQPSVALDFKDALVAEGYLRDALSVITKLVDAWPDSLSYRVDRASLYAKNGMPDEALSDLHYVRNHGLVDLDVIGAEATILAGQGKIDQALDTYREGLLLFPELGEDLYLGMAALLQRAQRIKDMEPVLAEAVAAYPDSPSLRAIYIRSLAGAGKHREALDAARQADTDFALSRGDGAETTAPPAHGTERGRVGPLPESFVVELADFYAVHGDYDRAVGILEPMEQRQELDLGPSLWLARLYLGRGSFEQGAALVETILERWPDSGRAWYLKGGIAESQDDHAGALRLYRRAVDLAEDDPEIRLALVRTMIIAWEADLVTGRDDAESRKEAQDLQVQTSAANLLVPEVDTEGQLILGYAWKLLKDYERAIDRFELAAQDPELHLRAQVQVSICQDEAGQIEEALATLRALRKEYPDDAEVANSLGYFLAEKNQDLDYAEQLVTEALAADTGNGAYLDSLGWVYYRQGRFDDALDYLIRAVNVLPEDPVILEHLGVVLHQQGQNREAVDMLKRSLQLGGNRARLEDLLAEIESAGDGDSR